MLLPDRISIDNVKERMAELNESAQIQKIDFMTFEQLARRIVESAYSHPEIMETEIRRLIVVESLKEMASSGNIIANNLWNLVKDSSTPENEEAIKSIDTEFDDFLRCAYPPQLELASDEYFSEMEKISDKVHGSFYQKTAKDALEFYYLLENKARSKIDDLGLANYYLSRTHIVGKAVETLKQDNKLIKKINPDVCKFWVSAVSVFDVSILELLNQVNNAGIPIRINTGSMTAERLKLRLKKGWNIKSKKIEGTDLDGQIAKIELPDMKRETEYVVADIAKRITEKSVSPKDVVLFARDSSQYMPYLESILGDYGLSGHVQTRRSVALTPAFRLAASILNLMALIEMKKGIKASDITDPLRLGFTPGRRLKPLNDSTFLYLESRVGLTGGEREFSWAEWKMKLARIKSGELDDFVKWINSRVGVPSSEVLRAVLYKFGMGSSNWKNSFKPSNGFNNDRSDLTKEHITSHANRIISDLYRVQRFAEISKDLGGIGKVTWLDIVRAFYSIAGSETYGIPNRDLNAVRVIDAGNSHFINGKVRYILGLKSKGFPRKSPSGILLSDEYRKQVNEEYGPLYLRAPDTDFENEHDFFDAAFGSDSIEERVFTMPYLDDRGHKEEWSVFTHDFDVVPKHIGASKFIINDSQDFSPISSLRASSLIAKNCESTKKDYKKIVNPEFTNIVDNEIYPRISHFEDVILNPNYIIDNIDLADESYLKDFIHDVKKGRIPAHEINLYDECSLMYYFYKYLYCMGPYSKNQNEGSRKFVPEWKSDFKLGQIPLPLRRKHISTKAESLLSNILSKNKSSMDLKTNEIKISSEIDAEKNIDFHSKRLLKSIVSYLIDENYSSIVFNEAADAGGEPDLWRPAYVKADNKLIHFGRSSAKDRKNKAEPHVLHFRSGKFVVVPNAKPYGKMKDVDYIDIKTSIRNLTFGPPDASGQVCVSCVYRTLCGNWGI